MGVSWLLKLKCRHIAPVDYNEPMGLPCHFLTFEIEMSKARLYRYWLQKIENESIEYPFYREGF